MGNPADLDVLEAAAALGRRELSSEELVTACLERIDRRDPGFGAFVRLYPESALAAARQADGERAKGASSPLLGVPIALKDVIGAEGRPLTADSAVLEGNVAPHDATAWGRARAGGMVLLGHLHCGEFAYGHFGRNPWVDERSPGGSSSGSGIALAARLVPATLGTDARGSIRMPATFNAVTGLKPTFGLVSTAGCVPITLSYDTVGPMARSAADCAALLSLIAGPDPADPPTRVQPPPRRYPTEPRPGGKPLADTRIGVATFAEPLAAAVGEAYENLQSLLARLGAELVPLPWPENPLELEGDAGYIRWLSVLGAEASLIHEQFADRRHRYGEEFRDFLDKLPSDIGAVDYLRAQHARGELAKAWRARFSDLGLDVLVHPAAMDEPYRVGDPITPELLHRLLYGVWNDTGFPALAIPAGFSKLDGSPVGMELVGLPFSDAELLQVAIDLQAASDHHRAIPPGLDQRSPLTSKRRAYGLVQRPLEMLPNPFAAILPLRSDG